VFVSRFVRQADRRAYPGFCFMSGLCFARGLAVSALLCVQSAYAQSPLEMLQSELASVEAGQQSVSAATGKTRRPKEGFAKHIELAKQIDSVSTGCFTPQLRQALAQIGGHFGQTVMVTSGYRRSRSSYHGKCMAADIQITGVSPGAIFAYARSMPAVGGVGRYGHTRSIHVDVAPRKYSWGTGRKRYAALGNCCPECASLAARSGGAAKMACSA
jgi:uncharacterized protein YcbK (DUF882 family)